MLFPSGMCTSAVWMNRSPCGPMETRETEFEIFGALLGGGIGMLKGGAGSEREREDLYRRYYDDCMRGVVN